MGKSRSSTHRKTRRHLAQIRTLYKKTDESLKHDGRHWYLREHKEALRLARRTGHPLRLVCACLAVLSPRCQWRRAKKACEQLLKGQEPPGIFSHNLAKAGRILATGSTDLICPRQAPKTWAFWQNLWRPVDPEPVTLDSWMFRAHKLPPTAGLTLYRALAEAYRRLAPELRLLPNQLQAIVWLHAKATLSDRRFNGFRSKA